ncbi:MAG: hypothetical protein E6G39_01335 [Actinobacteria bacterium]|nr:MAG: hypothetical protein E6G39_01335 [Actinomycetota bacterium]
MLGYAPRCVFMVFANPPADRVDELHHWYQVIHGPDAIENGSFNALRRYRCVSNPDAPLLALWEGEWSSDKAAWDFIAPKAKALHESGRIGDIPSADWASMTFTSEPPCAPLATEPVGSMTMVQSDWYYPVREQSLAAWAKDSGLDADRVGGPWHSRYFYSADPLVEAGLHAAFFESAAEVADVTEAWSPFGAPGPSPTRTFKGLFEERGKDGLVPSHAPAYVSHWEQIATLG